MASWLQCLDGTVLGGGADTVPVVTSQRGDSALTASNQEPTMIQVVTGSLEEHV